MTIREHEGCVTFECANCGSSTTLEGVLSVPADGLCPPCHFFGPDWEEDPVLVKLIDTIQIRNRQ